MTAPDKNAQFYLEKTISSARPEELTLMMYNGLMKFIARAQEEIKAKSPEAAHNTLIRCQDIVFEFQYTLNMDYEVSSNLMLIYDYLYNRLIEANAKKSVEILAEILDFVTELRDTWVEAVKLKKDVKPREEEAAPDQPRPKAIYTKNGRLAGATAAPAAQPVAIAVSKQADKKQAAQPAQSVAIAISKQADEKQAAQPAQPAAENVSDAPPATLAPVLHGAIPQTGGSAGQAAPPPSPSGQAPPTGPSGQAVSLPDSFEQAAAAARALNNPMNRINPAFAAKYAKISKSKNAPHEIISLTSK